MDKETLDQICLHRPRFSADAERLSLTRGEIAYIEEFLPKPEWYLESRIIDSIHGIAHTLRVMVYASILSQALDEEVRRSLLLACAVHDTRRLNDKGDEDHEKRALDWLLKNNQYRKYNEIAVSMLKNNGPYAEYLRTADALDRYRLPKVKWWIDDDYLSIKPSESLKAAAFNLVVESESARLNGTTDIRAVMSNVLVK